MVSRWLVDHASSPSTDPYHATDLSVVFQPVSGHTDFMKRDRQMKVFARGLVLALLLAVLLPAFIAAQQSGGLGTVDYLEGDVRINGVPADFGDTVAFGDRVQTGPDGSIDIVFDRSNVFRLGSNTVAVIEIGATRQKVDLQFGTVAAVFNRLRTLGGDGTFGVTTQTVAGGVRGTTFFFRVLDRDTTYVCVCNGALELDPHGDAEAFVNSAVEHSARYFRNVDGQVTVEVAGEQFHSNESLNEVADRIGSTIPWGSVPESSVQ